jgi:hypothetical protein
MDIADIIALVASLFAVGWGIWDRLASRRKARADAVKVEAEANEIIRQTVMELIAPLKKRIDELEQIVAELKAENADLKDWAARLVRQVLGFGGDPVKLIRCKQREDKG